jgi:O-antigen ligase
MNLAASPDWFAGHRARLTIAADVAAMLVAVSLPWSTSATGILLVVWLVVLLPTLDLATVRATLKHPAAFLPVLLWALAILGLLWGDVSWKERWAGVGGYNKLLVIPLLLLQFRRSPRGHWVLIGFAASAVALAIVSWLLVLLPGLTWRGKDSGGIPVKDYLSQSAICMVAAFGLLGLAQELWRRARGAAALALVVVAAVLLANIVYVATGRTGLIVIPILLLLLAGRTYGGKGLIGAVVVGSLLGGVAWASSPYLRDRVLKAFDEVQNYRSSGAITSSGMRLEFWSKAADFIAEAPLIGHGTGTMPDRFRRAAADRSGAASVPSVNPHNQVLAVAIELGLLGGAALLAMWLAHLALFRGGGLPAWIGLLIVAQNVISSLFNSHLFDFTHGWLYVVGVGVAGGMVLREPSRNAIPPAG